MGVMCDVKESVIWLDVLGVMCMVLTGCVHVGAGSVLGVGWHRLRRCCMQAMQQLRAWRLAFTGVSVAQMCCRKGLEIDPAIREILYQYRWDKVG